MTWVLPAAAPGELAAVLASVLSALTGAGTDIFNGRGTFADTGTGSSA